MSLNEKLTALANSIRTKSGASGLLSLDAMKTAVDSIQTGGGGSLPSSISKIDGGSFTLASDTVGNAYSWQHTLGVLPKGFMVWTEESPFEAYPVAQLVACVAQFNQIQTGTTSFVYGGVVFERRTTTGAGDNYSEMITTTSQLATYATTTTLKAVSTRFYRANATYKWLAWA